MEMNSKVIVPFALKGDNYLTWARTVRTSLGGRGYWEHIEVSKEATAIFEKKKEGEELTKEEKKWVQEDQMVLAVLQGSLELSILEGYSYCETAKELWDTLEQVYGDANNFTRVFQVQKALNELHQRDMDFHSHFGKFRTLWAELEMLRPATLDAKTLNERREQDKVFALLLTLSSGYNDLIQHILREKEIPKLEEVCARIQREKGTYSLFRKGELPMANAAITPEESPMANKAFKHEERRGAFQGTCDHCKRQGHKKSQCWFLHAHLRPSNNNNGSQNNRGNGNGNNNYNSYPRANLVGEGSSSKRAEGNGDVIMKQADIEALIQTLKSLNQNNSGISLFANYNSGTSLFANTPSDKLIIDSGASHHMISNSRLLENLQPMLGHVVIANGDRIPIEGIGCLNLFNKRSNAYYMPKFTSNLLSVNKMTKDLDCLAIFSPNGVQFQDIKSGKVLGTGGTKDELYFLQDLASKEISFNSAFQVTNDNAAALDVLWHARLGHPHSRALELLLPSVSFDSSRCEACILGKHCKVVFPHSNTIYEKCFDLVHSDVWTSPCVSRDNNKYFVTFIDEKSKYTWLTLIPSKDRVFEAFQDFQNHITNQYNAKIKVFRSDNGGEYMSQTFKAHLAQHGIIHQTSCPYTPQQNGVAERKNRHLMEVARSMMFHHNVPRRFWGDAVMTACYLINRTPTKVLNDRTPFEVLTSTKPFIKHLRVFGCVCFVLQQGTKDKLDARSTKAMFIGYSTTQKGYKCYDPSTHRTYVSREVKFFEEQGYHKNQEWDELKDLATSRSDQVSTLRYILEHLGNKEVQPQGTTTQNEGTNTLIQPQEEGTNTLNHQGEDDQTTARETQNVARDAARVLPQQEQGESSHSDSLILGDELNAGNEEEDEEEDEDHTTPVLRRSARIRSHPDTWINKRVYYNASAVAHPIQAVCCLDLLPAKHRAFMSKIEAHTIPQSYEEAQGNKKWVNAVQDEVQAMTRNHTWDEEVLPPGKKCVSSKWVFTIKYKSNGDIERYKARLVARGFTQTYGEDYTDTFAPVAKQHTVKVVLSIATNLDWELWQMDVKNAFLQGELEEEVYMTPPPGLEDSIAQDKVLRLRKAIYGLKQSPRAWYHKLSSMLKENGFKKSESDHTLFTLQNDQGLVVVLVYVDDLIISGNNKEGIKRIKSSLHSVFDIKDLGELKYFLGIEVCRSKEGLFLSQRKYTLDLLQISGKLGTKAASTPLEAGYKVSREGEKDDTPHKDANQYRRMVGKLIYLTYTRPDISFAVNQVSQHMQSPTVYHWSLVERILRYLKGSPGQGVWMGKNGSTEIVGYCDADWAGDRNDRKSTTGYCTFIGGNLTTWKTKKQKVVSCSSAEAEYRAMRKLTDELTWLKALLEDLGIKGDSPMTMHCDNQSAIHIATNPVFHERTKHIEIDCHKVREKIEEGVILPCYTRSEDQLADIFTKAASPKVCDHIHRKLGLVDLTHP